MQRGSPPNRAARSRKSLAACAGTLTSMFTPRTAARGQRMLLFPSDADLGHRGAFCRTGETAMFEAEARWLRGALDLFPPERLSPVLNLGSSSTDIREVVQPWIEEQLFRPLRTRGVEVIHVDRRELPGVDVKADLTNRDDVVRLGALHPGALLCCNLLEHVTEPDRLACHCLDLLRPGLRIRHILELQNVGIAELIYADGFHVCLFPPLPTEEGTNSSPIHRRHRRRGITLAGDCLRIRELLDPTQLIRCELQVDRRDVLFQIVHTLRAGDWHDVFARA